MKLHQHPPKQSAKFLLFNQHSLLKHLRSGLQAKFLEMSFPPALHYQMLLLTNQTSQLLKALDLTATSGPSSQVINQDIWSASSTNSGFSWTTSPTNQSTKTILNSKAPTHSLVRVDPYGMIFSQLVLRSMKGGIITNSKTKMSSAPATSFQSTDIIGFITHRATAVIRLERSTSLVLKVLTALRRRTTVMFVYMVMTSQINIWQRRVVHKWNMLSPRPHTLALFHPAMELSLVETPSLSLVRTSKQIQMPIQSLLTAKNVLSLQPQHKKCNVSLLQDTEHMKPTRRCQSSSMVKVMLPQMIVSSGTLVYGLMKILGEGSLLQFMEKVLLSSKVPTFW